MQAWNGDRSLRAAVLGQLDEQARHARLGLLRVEGQQLEIFGWGRVRDFDGLERALGFPAVLLRLGLELFWGPFDAELEELLTGVALGVLEGGPLEPWEPALKAGIARMRPATRDRSRDVEERRRACHKLWALETGLAACRCQVHADAIVDVASSDCTQLGLPPADGGSRREQARLEWMQGTLLSLLAQAR